MKRLLAMIALTVSSMLCVAAEPKLRAGAVAIDVTPTEFPISVNGGFADRKPSKANDPLHARCIVLDDGTTKLAIVVVDSCMLPRELIDEAKVRASEKTGIPTTNMLVSATHTHSAPTSTGVFQSDPDITYVKFLTGKIADGIIAANGQLKAAEVGWGVEKEPSQLFNRRWKMKPGTILKDPFGNATDRVRMNPGHKNPDLDEPAGLIDPDVSILAMRTLDGKPIALLANYSLHYVGDLPAISADYFGVFAERIAMKLAKPAQDPPFVGILSNGTSGDVNNVDFKNTPVKTQPGERCRNVAEVVATAAKKANDGAKFSGRITLAAAEQEVELKVRKPTADELKRAKEILEKAGDRVLNTSEEVYARETLLINKYPDTVKLKLQAFRIGELGIVAIPCETFTEIGLEIKKKSPLEQTFTIELANGYNGYLPTPAQHELGGYETWRARSSYLVVKASETIMKVVLELLGKVAK